MPWTEMPDDSKRKQKHSCGNRSQHNQGDIDDSMDFLPATAVLALGEVVLVVFAHLGRDAGDVVPPASQNLANEGINTLAHTKWLEPDGLQWFRLRCKHHPVSKQRLARPQSLHRRSPGNFGMV